ncbi:MAG: ribonuclease III, partial [Lysobacterales bacterium]
KLPTAAELKDPKTRLQEALQARGLPLPIYAVESTSGQAHNQSFDVSCSVDALGLKVTASGASRRRAEQAAAQLLLSALTGSQRERS